MKTTTLSTLFTPSFIVLFILATIVAIVGATGKKVPMLSNLRLDVVLLVILGMAMCTTGIGRVASMNAWTHPLAIFGYILGAAILLITIAVFTGWRLPFISSDQQAILAIAILMVAKIGTTLIHAFLVKA